jgi:hypothetical protein
VFIKDGREADSPPVPMHAARRIKRASTEQNEHVVAPGLLGRRDGNGYVALALRFRDTLTGTTQLRYGSPTYEGARWMATDR